MNEAEAAFLRALGKRVRILRLTAELTQEQLAEAAGMSRSFVSVVEHGAGGVDVLRLRWLALALGVALASLLLRAAADASARTDPEETQL